MGVGQGIKRDVGGEKNSGDKGEQRSRVEGGQWCGGAQGVAWRRYRKKKSGAQRNGLNGIIKKKKKTWEKRGGRSEKREGIGTCCKDRN